MPTAKKKPAAKAAEKSSAASSTKKLVVVITGNANGDRATIGFTVANASLSAGMGVLVFLASDGADLSRAGGADLSHIRPFRPLGDLMEDFASKGGIIAACGSCVQYRGIDTASASEHVQVAGVATLVDWLAEGAQTIAF